MRCSPISTARRRYLPSPANHRCSSCRGAASRRGCLRSSHLYSSFLPALFSPPASTTAYPSRHDRCGMIAYYRGAGVAAFDALCPACHLTRTWHAPTTFSVSPVSLYIRCMYFLAALAGNSCLCRRLLWCFGNDVNSPPGARLSTCGGIRWTWCVYKRWRRHCADDRRYMWPFPSGGARTPYAYLLPVDVCCVTTPPDNDSYAVYPHSSHADRLPPVYHQRLLLHALTILYSDSAYIFVHHHSLYNATVCLHGFPALYFLFMPNYRHRTQPHTHPTLHHPVPSTVRCHTSRRTLCCRAMTLPVWLAARQTFPAARGDRRGR